MRQAIRELISGITPFDDLEKTHQDETLAWIDTGVELCRQVKPAAPPRHLVSYFLAVDQDQALLVDHKGASLWLPSGGHVEPGEHPTETVTREAEEELGIKPELLFDKPLFLSVTETVGNTPGHIDVSLWYAIKGNRRKEYDFDQNEFHGVQWFDFDNMPWGRTDPHMGRFLNKLRSQR